MDTFIDKEIISFGSAGALAKAIGISVQRVINWRARGRIPADMVLEYCSKRHWQVTPHMVRADIYPHPDDGLPDGLRLSARQA